VQQSVRCSAVHFGHYIVDEAFETPQSFDERRIDQHTGGVGQRNQATPRPYKRYANSVHTAQTHVTACSRRVGV
jgi:hypothetical protein